MTQAEARRRAAEARRILDEPLLNEALDDMERAATADLLAVRNEDENADRKRQVLAERRDAVIALRRRLEFALAQSEHAAEQPERVG